MRVNVARVAVIILVTSALLFATGMKNIDSDDWESYISSQEQAIQRALAVNEGDLEFLTSPPDKPPHVLNNELTITQDSLASGWVHLLQCHNNLDKVNVAQILYHPRRTRNISVASYEGIERAWVEDNSVQLINISGSAKICVEAEVHSLYSNFDGSFSMHNGPFHRRFLDGYYPMRVTMDVKLPSDYLSFEAINPQAQQGFSVSHEKGRMTVDALFVGELNIEVYFEEINEIGPG